MNMLKMFALLFTLIFGFGLFLNGCDRPNRIKNLKHKNKILEFRKLKNKMFKYSQDSPIPAEQRWEFNDLIYFPVDTDFWVDAEFTKATELNEFKIVTTAGPERVYVIAGRLDFTIDDQKFSLNGYQEKARIEQGDRRSLFVPFSDETSGKETYGAGRYLDLKVPSANKVTLDFNLAYNPYCAYSQTFSCPLPPKENHLPIPIKAGEKYESVR